MKNLSIMLKPASSGCNLRCKYCFYADLANLREIPTYGVMSRDTMAAILENIRRDLVPGDRVTFAFQGGEPTLAGLDYFREFVGLTEQWDKGISVSYALQTNATLLNDDWCAFFARHRFLIGVSLDLLPQCHDSVRVDCKGNGTYRQVLRGIRLLEDHKAEYNVLCTLTNPIARHPQKVWKQIEALNLQYVQFTPCLDKLECPGESVYALTPERFAAFYQGMFPLWLEAYRKGQYRSVKLFDDIVNLLAFGTPTACGIDGRCRPQIVVEADGTAYPCDFYCLDRYRTGNLANVPLREIWGSPVNREFVCRPHTAPALCGDCPFAKFCGGGCKRMQEAMCCRENDRFCGYRALLSSTIGAFQAIAREQRARRGYSGF